MAALGRVVLALLLALAALAFAGAEEATSRRVSATTQFRAALSVESRDCFDNSYQPVRSSYYPPFRCCGGRQCPLPNGKCCPGGTCCPHETECVLESSGTSCRRIRTFVPPYTPSPRAINERRHKHHERRRKAWFREHPEAALYRSQSGSCNNCPAAPPCCQSQGVPVVPRPPCCPSLRPCQCVRSPVQAQQDAVTSTITAAVRGALGDGAAQAIDVATNAPVPCSCPPPPPCTAVSCPPITRCACELLSNPAAFDDVAVEPAPRVSDLTKEAVNSAEASLDVLGLKKQLTPGSVVDVDVYVDTKGNTIGSKPNGTNRPVNAKKNPYVEEQRRKLTRLKKANDIANLRASVEEAHEQVKQQEQQLADAKKK